MLSVSDAFAITQQHLLTLPTDRVSIDNALGRVLREPVRADRDFPPFDRVAMDGIGIRFADLASGTQSFHVVGTQRAGQAQQTLTEPGTCLEVMTGAMLPIGVDTVIRYEDVTITDGKATITIEDIVAGLNIHHRATDRRAGDELMSAGTRLGPAELAVAASVGHVSLLVTSQPRVALVSTGDELVDIADTPLPYQIRRSNTYMIRAALAMLGINATLNHIVDDKAVLTDSLATLLAENDVLILSGGVSAGKADFVPDVLTGPGRSKTLSQDRTAARQTALVRYYSHQNGVRPARQSGLDGAVRLPLRIALPAGLAGTATRPAPLRTVGRAGYVYARHHVFSARSAHVRTRRTDAGPPPPRLRFGRFRQPARRQRVYGTARRPVGF